MDPKNPPLPNQVGNPKEQKPELEFQDDTVQALLVKARKDAEERAQMYSANKGVLSSVPPGTRGELETGIKFEPVIEPAQTPVVESTKFEAVPVEVTQNTQEAVVEHDTSLKNLRTYQGDVAEALKDQNASTISIAMAQRKRDEKRPRIVETPNELKRERKNTWLAIGSAAFLVIGLAILGGLYYVHVQNLPVPVAEAPKTLISFDKSTEILFQGLTKDKFMSLIFSVKAKVGVHMGEINYLNIIKRGGTTPETTTSKPIGAKDLFSLLKTKTPQTLTNSISEKFMLGSYQGKLPGIFILVGITSYENAFDGMLRWENNLWNDLGALFSQNPIPVSAQSIQNELATTTSTTTASKISTTTSATQSTTSPIAPITIPFDANKVSSTTVFLPSPLVKDSFIDKVISNKDTRILQNQFGETVFVYGFVTKDLLLMASNEETFKAILDRAFVAQGQ
ncbi:MAG: hypothetical protein WA051_01520 [Minisyncoccia bacterium]